MVAYSCFCVYSSKNHTKSTFLALTFTILNQNGRKIYRKLRKHDVKRLGRFLLRILFTNTVKKSKIAQSRQNDKKVS